MVFTSSAIGSKKEPQVQPRDTGLDVVATPASVSARRHYAFPRPGLHLSRFPHSTAARDTRGFPRPCATVHLRMTSGTSAPPLRRTPASPAFASCSSQKQPTSNSRVQVSQDLEASRHDGVKIGDRRMGVGKQVAVASDDAEDPFSPGGLDGATRDTARWSLYVADCHLHATSS